MEHDDNEDHGFVIDQASRFNAENIFRAEVISSLQFIERCAFHMYAGSAGKSDSKEWMDAEWDRLKELKSDEYRQSLAGFWAILGAPDGMVESLRTGETLFPDEEAED